MIRKSTAPWPADVPPAEEVARVASYVGSPEHKTAPSDAGPPRLRHNDASPCDTKYRTFEAPTAALREAIRSARTSEFIGHFPKYVWGRLDGVLYEARIVNAEQGTYKAYPLDGPEELPVDPVGVLAQL